MDKQSEMSDDEKYVQGRRGPLGRIVEKMRMLMFE